MCDCLGKLFFTILTLCSIGLTTGSVIAVLAIFQVQKFSLHSDKINIRLIAAVCLSVVTRPCRS
jgi:hypothetical protein